MTPEQLKASILQYAMKGKLVEQREEEGTAEELYQQIQEEKQRLIKEGKIKKEKKLAEITEDEIPFDIPESWKWVRVNDLVCKDIKRGKSPTYTDKSVVQVFAQKCNTKIGKIDMNLARFLDESKLSKYSEEEFMQDNDIVINSTGTGTMGRIGIFQNSDRINNMKIVPDSHVTIIRTSSEYIFPIYVYYYLKANQNYLESMGEGSTNQKELKPLTIKNMVIPLPPHEEQHRIVAKIEKLLPFVDRYAASYEKLEQLNAKFPEDMKKSILQYAIQGKLVEQRPEEGTAEELYQQIQEEKQKLIEEGKIKKEKKLAGITEDEIPFEIPESWKWVRVNDLVGKDIKRGKSPTYTDKSVIQVFAQKCNTKIGKIDMNLARFLDESKLSKYSEEEFMQDNDVVINSTGTGTMGRIGLFQNSDRINNMKIVPDSHVTIIRTNSDYVFPIYVYYYLKANQNYLESIGEGSTNQKELKPLTIKNMVIPLPPLEEQHRIVAKIEELLPYCERLQKLQK